MLTAAKFRCLRNLFSFLFLSVSFYVNAQSPGQIVRRTSVDPVLDPVSSTGYTSTSINGFVNSDITESRLPFKPITLPFSEPVGDLATGASGSFTDIITSPTDKSGLMAYYDGTNLIFRIRIGGISSGAKAYSILIDADNKAGSMGSQADGNYVAPTATGTGNIGFEWEVLLATGNSTTVSVYETDGKTGPSIVKGYSVTNSNYQISQALTTNSNNPDYFYDFYVPLTAFTGTYAITSTTKFRMVATTVNSPTSALTGSRSDILGADDRNYSSTPEEWLAVINGTPPVTLSSLGGSGTTATGYCTAAPTLNSPINAGTGVTISGTWTRTDNTRPSSTIINLYKLEEGNLNFVTSIANVQSGAGWSINGLTIKNGESYIAKAISTGESECLRSNIVTSSCSVIPAAPIITCASTKGIVGTVPSGSTILIYNTASSSSPTSSQLVTGTNTNYNGTTFNFWGVNTVGSNTTQSNPVCNGQNDFVPISTTIMLVSQNGGCLSNPTYICITGASYSAVSTTGGPVISSPLYQNASVSGTGVTNGQILRLYVDENYVASMTATGTTFAFPYIPLTTGQKVKVYAQGTSTTCATVSAIRTVDCYTQPPVMNTDNNGNLIAGVTSISGTATPGASISVSRVLPSAAGPYTATANASTGIWSVSVPALVAGQTYTATATVGSCASAATNAISVVGQAIAICPTITSPITDNTTVPFTVSGKVDNSAPGAGAGTLRLYYDGVLVNSSSIATVGTAVDWSISVPSSYSPYSGGILQATYQVGSNAEYRGCLSSGTSYQTITCSSPAMPTISPITSSISTGNTVQFSVSNLASNTWYAVIDNSGISYATSVLNSNSTSINITTKQFTTPGTYNLKVTADQLTGCPASFRSATITVADLALPVRFLNVSAKREVNKVRISWSVAEEQDVAYYQVERSAEGSSFQPIGRVLYKPPTGQTNEYSFFDESPSSAGLITYRVKQVDLDGKYTYSKVVNVNNHGTSASIRNVHPNPVINELKITLTLTKSQTVSLNLVNTNGQKVKSKVINGVQGTSEILFTDLNNIPEGIYMLVVSSQDGEMKQKLVKVK